MTETTMRTRAGVAARISAWAGRCQRELFGRIHAAADDRAQRYGWTVTEATGWFGFQTRSYRDPRFDNRRRQLSPGPGLRQTRREAMPAREAEE